MVTEVSMWPPTSWKFHVPPLPSEGEEGITEGTTPEDSLVTEGPPRCALPHFFKEIVSSYGFSKTYWLYDIPIWNYIKISANDLVMYISFLLNLSFFFQMHVPIGPRSPIFSRQPLTPRQYYSQVYFSGSLFTSQHVAAKRMHRWLKLTCHEA